MNSRKALKKQNELLKKFKTLTRVMSPKGDITIVVTGDTAKTDGNTIVLPYGDFADANYCELLEGLADHEVGHVDESCFEALDDGKDRGEFFRSILNILEDVRMENCRVRKFPGTRINFSNTVNQAIKRGWFQDPAQQPNCHPAGLFTSYILYEARSVFMEQSQLAGFAASAKSLLSNQIGDMILSDLDKHLAQIPTLTSTLDCFKLAERVVKLLEDEVEEDDSQEGDPGESNDSQDSGDQQSGDSNSNGAQGENQTDQGEDESSDGGSQDSDQNDSSGENQSDQDGDDKGESSQANDNQTGNKSPANLSKNDFINECLTATEDEVQSDLHEQMREELENMVEDALDDGRVSGDELNQFSVKRVIPEARKTGSYFKPTAVRAGAKVKVALAKSLHDLNRRSVNHASRGGNIDPMRLAGVRAGNFSIFKTERITKAPNAAISLLIDNSSSMKRDMGMANTCALALALAFEKLPDVKSEVMYFPHYERNYNGVIDGYVHLAKGFNERVSVCEKHFAVRHNFDTPTGNAMSVAIKRLALRPETKKLLFIVTDGESDSPAYVAQMVNEALLLNISVVPIIIKHHAIKGFEGVSTVRVDDISQLHIAIKDAIKSKLI